MMATYQTTQVGSQEQGRYSGGFQTAFCSRCGGLLIEESLFDFLDDSGHMRCWAFRCVQCGNVVDPLILKNKTCAVPPSPKKQHRRRWPNLQSQKN